MKTKIEQFPDKNPNPVLSVAKDGTVFYSNEAGKPLLYEWGVAVGEKLPSSIGEIVQRVIHRNSPEKMEVKVGNIVYLIAFHPLPKEECVSIYGFDISDQKKLEEKLKESERRLSEAQRMAHIGNWDWNIVANKMYRSDEMHRIFGLNPQELDINYGVLLKYIHPDDRVDLDNAMIDTLNGNPFDNNYRIILANGEEHIVHIKGEVVFDEKNTPVRIKGILQDVTELKRAEEKLRASEEKYRDIVETANEGISTIDAEFKVTYVNKKMAEMFGCSPEEIIGRLMWDFISAESKAVVKLKLEKGWQSINESLEIKYIRKDGSPLWALVNAKSHFDKEGKFMGLMNMLTDITKRKEAEEALAKIESTRRKEIHHRIKNNLQVIYSLLDLQADIFKGRKNISDTEVLNAFKESQDRVTSMALIHEELYRGGELDKVDISSYIEKLSENLFQTYRVGNTNVSLNMDLEENLFFDINNAVSLGIIINELVSNSFKYAFQGRDKGEIRIRFGREKGSDTHFVLTVSDNGIGISENIDIRKLGSLGLNLVASLVEQLDGELELKRNYGTEFTIRLTVTEKNNQVP